MAPQTTIDRYLLKSSNPSEKDALVICSMYVDERPLKNAAGLLDWHLKGFISRFLINGWIDGDENEFIYVPVQRQGKCSHLLFVGLGKKSAAPSLDSKNIFKKIQTTAKRLGFERLVVSQSSFPALAAGDVSDVEKLLPGLKVELVQ